MDVQSTNASDVLAGRGGNQLGCGNRANAGSNPTPWQEASIKPRLSLIMRYQPSQCSSNRPQLRKDGV